MKQARGDVAMIKDLLYPDKKQNNKVWQKKYSKYKRTRRKKQKNERRKRKSCRTNSI